MNVDEYLKETRTETTARHAILITVVMIVIPVLAYIYVIYLLIKNLLFDKSKLVRIFSALGLVAIAVGTIVCIRYILKDDYTKIVAYQSKNDDNANNDSKKEHQLNSQHQNMNEQPSVHESVERNSKDIETHPVSTENSIPIPVIKNSDGVYDWQSMCQKEWPKSFLEIQRALSVFGGFQLAQSPIDGFKLDGFELTGIYGRDGYKPLMIQEGIPLLKKYRYFQKADLTFFHGALIKFTLKAEFPKKYSMASVDREYKALQNDINENLKCLNKPDVGIGIGLKVDRDWVVVLYGQEPRPGVHNIVGRIDVTAVLGQDDHGYHLKLSIDTFDEYDSNGLRKFIEQVIKQEAYEAGEELEGFDKIPQSSDDSTKVHPSRNRAPKSTDRKDEEAERRSARTETPVPSLTISVPEGKEVSPNLPDESTDHQPQQIVQQSAERKADNTATPSTRTESSIPSPTIPVSNRKESSSDQSPPVRTNKAVKIPGFNSYKFGQKYPATRMTAEMRQEGGLAIKPVKINYRKFRTLELGYAIDGKQLCHLKLCAEFPSNADDDQLNAELMNVRSDLERQLGFEMTGSENEANYEDEKYVVKLWHHPTTKTVYNTRHVSFRKQRIANTINIKCLYLLLEDKRLMPK